MSQRLGIFGGTFDPPHVGHLLLAAEAYNQLNLEKVLWVLTPAPPHKQSQSVTPVEARLEMLAAALQGEQAFELSEVDLQRPPPHYAADTVDLIQRAHPGASLIYLMGGDSLCDLPTWHHPRKFIRACHAIAVMKRPNQICDLAELERSLPGLGEKVCFLEAPYIEISSSRIRRLVAENKLYHFYLPEAVVQVINNRGLYRD